MALYISRHAQESPPAVPEVSFVISFVRHITMKNNFMRRFKRMDALLRHKSTKMKATACPTALMRQISCSSCTYGYIKFSK